MEYMGEIVSTAQFRKRARVYQQEGIRHQYFMSIGNNKIIDATRKGSVARFINHSCGPNCVLQKWMVAGAIRMGIFAERPIKRGEEITFDYKFERMAGAEPQPCYCGAPECKGIIGVAKERRRKHVQVAEEADVDIEDDGDDAADIDEEIDDLTVTKRQRDDIRRRHAAMDDDDYGSSGSNRGELSDSEDSDDPDAAYGSRQQRRGRRKGLTSPEQVLKFVQIMHQSAGETRIIGILIGKLMETSDRRLLKSLIGLQALGILRSWLQEYKDDDVILIKILQCIDHLPISTRNSIEESRLEDVVAPLCSFSDENVASIASKLVERWKTLRVVFKIPKKSRKESANITPSTSSVAAVCSSTESQPAGGKALAPGWRTAYTADGVPYYYHESTKETQWEAPLAEPDRTAATVGSTDRVLSSTAMAIVAPQPVAAQPVDQQRVFSAAGDATVPTTAAGDSRLPLESGRWPPAATAPASRGFAGVAAAPVAAVSMAVSGAATPAVVHEEKVDGFSKSRVDEIIERTMRLGNPSSSTMSLPQLPGSTTSGIVSSASGGSGSMQQLVTPDTDGEPSGSAVHQSRSLAGSSSLRKHSTPGSITGSPAAGPGGPARREKLEKKATAELAAYVVRQMNKYKSQMAHDEFKHEARKITKILMEKERKLPGFDPVKLIVLTAHKKAKVKQFVSEYMMRLAGRRGSSLSSVAGSPAGSAVGKTPPGPPFTPANI
ncbi:hypothetical protein FBU59_001911 [Linderina macrospora]|uniref:Uncharacterized protein n=1 Tax=Linderina macrospora TaxID=4868 RepID=A0ACC1JCJ4_9FUNG|nr:hypothetical protein FBU59_001911 [Linderina macrospora]